ncbi:MAG: sugar phosphate isomerase/epimerase family protein [Vicinamibacterales bacterium]
MSLRFAISTRLVSDARLDSHHLATFAKHGFSGVSLVACRTHVDYSDPGTIADLPAWLTRAGLTLDAMQAPRGEGLRAGRWVAPFSVSSQDDAQRQHAVEETRRAMDLAAAASCPTVTVSLERPGLTLADHPDSATSARRSLEELVRHAEAAGVTLALRVGTGPLSTADALLRLIEHDLDGSGAGICVDYGHAHMRGDVVDALETAAEYMVLALLHDNHGRRDDHLVPGIGTIDWASAMMTTQKLGYDGPLVMDVYGADRDATVQQASRARERLQAMLTVF